MTSAIMKLISPILDAISWPLGEIAIRAVFEITAIIFMSSKTTYRT